MDDNPVERLLTVLPLEADMPEVALVHYLVRHSPAKAATGGAQAAKKMVDAVASLARAAEQARLPLALPARMAANRLASANREQVLAWMRTAADP